MVRREAGDGVWPPGRRTLVRAARASVRGLPGVAKPAGARLTATALDRMPGREPRRGAGLSAPRPPFPLRSVVLATLAQCLGIVEALAGGGASGVPSWVQRYCATAPCSAVAPDE